MPTFAAKPLTAFAKSLLEKAGVPAADATVVADHLVLANLCGHDSHGVMRVPNYIQLIRDGKYKPGAEFKVLRETPAVIAVDGGWGLGQVQANKLLEKLIPKAKTLGMASGTIHSCGHTGRLGDYAERAAAQGLAFFATVNTHGAGRRVAPPGGTEGRISTNPICLGVPTAGDPIVLDFGTSVAAEGKVRGYFQKGEPCPEGWLVDSTGQPTTDPAVLYTEPRGTILPFGGSQGYKGFGLGLLLDMLAGGLSGGACSNPNAPMAGIGNAVLFALFDPAAFGGPEHFLNETTNLAAYVRSCPTAPGVASITLPGDPERILKAKRSAEGISIPDGTWKLLTDEATKFGVALPE
ncbi:Ldh family oxidoreductase [soil metagenome]